MYGLNDRQGRRTPWSDLVNCAKNDSLWIILGNFNALMNIEDRIGQAVREREILDMKRCMESFHVTEVKASGQFYTLYNKQEGDDKVFCKLDKVLGNDGWMIEWCYTEVIIHPEGEYDHCTLVLKSFVNEVKKKPFRFFNMWCQAEAFSSIVNQGWQQPIAGTNMFQIVSKLKL